MQLIYRKEALKVLSKLPKNVALLVKGKIEALAADPFASNSNVKALEGTDGYRLRIGDWRIIYRIHGETLEVLRIGSRGGIYK